MFSVILFQSVACISSLNSVLVFVCAGRIEVLNCDEVQFSDFSPLNGAVGAVSEKSLLNPRSPRFSPVTFQEFYFEIMYFIIYLWLLAGFL